MSNKLSVEQRIQKAHVWLMKSPKYCLYSGVMMLGKVEVDETMPTAATDGRDVFYGRKFMSKLTDAEVKAVILHENLHKAFRHTLVWKHLYKKHATLANMACDYVINLMIYDSDVKGVEVKLPADGLLDEQFRGMDASEVFRRLEKEIKDTGGVHVRTFGDPNGKFVPAEGCGSMDEHMWEKAEGMTQQEKETLANEVDQALRQGAILAGKMGGNIDRAVTEALTPQVDWRSELREFISALCQDKDESTWRRPSRRWIGQDVYMPSVIGETVGRIVVGVDTSGSIQMEDIAQFLGEVKSICDSVRPEAIELMYWDTRVCQHEVYEQADLDNLLASTRPKGGGGTDPECIPKFMNARNIKAECAIILTDGYVCSWGSNWSCPTLWAITSDIVSEVGKTIRIH